MTNGGGLSDLVFSFFLLPLLDLYCLSYICVGQLFIYIYEF